jgi:hypothetical protein
MGPIGCPETSITANNRYVTSQETEGHSYGGGSLKSRRLSSAWRKERVQVGYIFEVILISRCMPSGQTKVDNHVLQFRCRNLCRWHSRIIRRHWPLCMAFMTNLLCYSRYSLNSEVCYKRIRQSHTGSDVMSSSFQVWIPLRRVPKPTCGHQTPLTCTPPNFHSVISTTTKLRCLNIWSLPGWILRPVILYFVTFSKLLHKNVKKARNCVLNHLTCTVPVL